MNNLDTSIGLFGGGQTTYVSKEQRGGSTTQPSEWPKELFGHPITTSFTTGHFFFFFFIYRYVHTIHLK
jgi:hypothetical protein